MIFDFLHGVVFCVIYATEKFSLRVGIRTFESVPVFLLLMTTWHNSKFWAAMGQTVLVNLYIVISYHI